jgi:hypothetical protein
MRQEAISETSPSFPIKTKQHLLDLWADLLHRRHLGHFAFFLIFGICLSIPSAQASDIDPAATAIKEIVRISNSGVTPKNSTLDKLDSSLFFYNDISNEPVHLSIDFGATRIHCHSSNLTVNENGMMETKSPIIPGSFVIACFPEADTYAYTVSSEKGRTLASGKILVPGGQK